MNVLESLDFAELWVESQVHDKKKDWNDSSQNPESDNKVEFERSSVSDPECYQDAQNESVHSEKHEAKEGEITQVRSMSKQLSEEVKEHQYQKTAEGKRNNRTLRLRFRWEVIGNDIIKLVIISDAQVVSILRAFVQIDLQQSQILDEWFDRTWVFNVDLKSVVSVDLFLHQAN